MSDTHSKLYSTAVTITTKNIGLSLRPQLIFSKHNPTHLSKQQTLSPNHQFSQRTRCGEYYSVHAYMA